VDLYTSMLFGSSIQPLAPMQLRDISTKRVHQIPPYFQFKNEFLTDANWYEQITLLETKMNTGTCDDNLAEHLYQQLIWSCQAAGSKLKPYFHAPYSPDIERMRKIQKFLKVYIKSLTSPIEMSFQLDECKAKLGSLGVDAPDTLKECQARLYQHIREMKATM
jgi:hypothetical protein